MSSVSEFESRIAALEYKDSIYDFMSTISSTIKKAIVSSVDESTGTCTVTIADNGTVIEDCKICIPADLQRIGFYPTVQSTVIIEYIGSYKNATIIAPTSLDFNMVTNESYKKSSCIPKI